VLSDIVMPGMDGFELCRHIKGSVRGKHVPVILLTAMNDPMDIARGLEAGAEDFITKPYDPADLIGKVRRVLAPPTGDIPGGTAVGDDRAQMIRLLVGAFEETAHKGAELEARNAELAATKAKIEDYAGRLKMEHENILDSVGEGIFGLDPGGKIIFVNPSASDALGWGHDELIGQNAHETLMHSRADGSPYPPGESPVLAVLGGHQPYHRAEAALWRRDGVLVPVEHTCTPMKNEKSAIVGAVVAFRDITDRKRAEAERGKLEEEFRQSQKMEAVGRLAGGVAHDFNNMLTVIIGFSDLLLEKVTEEGPIRQRIGQIRTAAEHAAKLTKQLLAFSRRQVLQPRVDVSFALDPAAGMVMADPGQIGQVVMNLAVNARDAMPGGGRITITVANEAQAPAEPAGPSAPLIRPSVILAVTDTGTGMDEATKARIFEPFFTTKPVGSGTGLGLSTVYGIVQQSGGTITVDSEPGHGTTFRIRLPRLVSPVATATVPGERPVAAQPGVATILVVEDEDGVRDLVREILEGAGHRILTAAGPKDAIVLSAKPEGRADLVLTDMVMPGMTGKELAGLLQGKHPELRVLFMSGHTVQATDEAHRLASGDAFIQKPFTPAALIEKVREVLTRAR
jgi:hypothetical protein